jgi:hypothetical protein
LFRRKDEWPLDLFSLVCYNWEGEGNEGQREKEKYSLGSHVRATYKNLAIIFQLL